MTGVTRDAGIGSDSGAVTGAGGGAGGSEVLDLC